MMSGFKLTVGEAKEVYLTESDLWRHTQLFLMNAKHSANYKHILMKALLECMPEIGIDGKITFMQITRHVAKIYWNLVITHGLRQMRGTQKMSGVESTLYKFQEKYLIPKDWVFDRIPSEQQELLIKQINKVFKTNVYGSFYYSFDHTVYSFNVKEEWLQITPPYRVFFEKYKTILMNVTNYQLALFLEQVNPHEAMQHILTKLEFVSARHSLEPFRAMLEMHGLCDCFYCKKNAKKMHVDHFVPWSYVQNDVVWNFVLACQSCNTSKNNKLAHKDYLDCLIERNNKWSALNYDNMETYEEKKLVHLYEYAIQNGFQSDWRPNR